MKRIFLGLSLLAFVLNSQAQPPQGNQHEGKRPCLIIMKACEDAGFIKGGYKSGKGIMANCMKPLMEGQEVPGVKVDSATLEACKARHKERMQNRQENPANKSKQTPGSTQ